MAGGAIYGFSMALAGGSPSREPGQAICGRWRRAGPASAGFAGAGETARNLTGGALMALGAVLDVKYPEPRA